MTKSGKNYLLHFLYFRILDQIWHSIAELEKLEYPTPTRMAQEKNLPVEAKMFNHGGRRKTVKK